MAVGIVIIIFYLMLLSPACLPGADKLGCNIIKRKNLSEKGDVCGCHGMSKEGEQEYA